MIGLTSLNSKSGWPRWVTLVKGQIELKNGKIIASATDPDWDVSSEIKVGEQLRIPNTILALWVGDLGNTGKKAVGWDDDLKYLEDRGFLVVRQDASTKNSRVLNWVEGESKGKALHGLFVTGHGSRKGFGTGDKFDKKNPGLEFWITYNKMKDAMMYDLGLVILNVCKGGYSQFDRGQSTYGGKDLVSNSPGAVFYGIKRTLVPPGDSAHPSKLLKPGDQGTKP